MLRDDASNFATTPTTTMREINDHEIEPLREDPLDDVFGGSEDGHTNPQDDSTLDGDSTHQRRNDVSDIPRLQSIHTTNGYREGISASKEKHLQEGFDEGYSLGAEIGGSAGRIIGLLEGLAAALRGEDRTALIAMLRDARADLTGQVIYGKHYFGDDGIWKYEVKNEGEGGGEDDVTFRMVASCHPLIVKWNRVVNEHLEKYGLTAELS